MPYQSFPGVPGDSDSQGKLQALALPELLDKSLLDVGCDSGFFCGAALALGASRVLGIDANAKSIEAAQKKFPAADFMAKHWDDLPEENFDVILLLSAIHYADDQPTLIRRLVDRLTPDGVLILELGIYGGEDCSWHTVPRAIDSRIFPTMGMIRQVLNSYNYRLIGESVAQIGDPVPRYVFHIRKRRPMVLACLADSSTGKSDLSRRMASAGGSSIAIASIDDEVLKFRNEMKGLPASLTTFSLEDLSAAYVDICHSGQIKGLARAVAHLVKNQQFALVEGSIPAGFRMAFIKEIQNSLNADVWMLTPGIVTALNFSDLGNLGATVDGGADDHVGADSLFGHIDEVLRIPGGIIITGWGFDRRNELPVASIRIQHGDSVMSVDDLNRRRRPDAMSAMKSAVDLLGFTVEISMAEDRVDAFIAGILSGASSIRLVSQDMVSERLKIS